MEESHLEDVEVHMQQVLDSIDQLINSTRDYINFDYLLPPLDTEDNISRLHKSKKFYDIPQETANQLYLHSYIFNDEDFNDLDVNDDESEEEDENDQDNEDIESFSYISDIAMLDKADFASVPNQPNEDESHSENEEDTVLTSKEVKLQIALTYRLYKKLKH
ncbi:hypothetical protein WICMUC_003661 [Wickerhamomyces mucosus]|uniref:Uncharacterized protein n=1 Tax=Wickerhamomyces mucosus TaxID=1378264 RepID=A0A9P8PLF1_9ASCO|nr:hypothetical protein WICMUC_003661 [Wickerhamomyces mucosus]